MARLLLVTCGDTDLRTVVGSAGGEALALLAGPTQRALHEGLLDGSVPWSVDEAAADLPRLDHDRVWFTERGLVLAANEQDVGSSEASPTDRCLRLTPVKLAGIAATFREKNRPDTIVVLNTRRTQRPDEPIATGHVLANWLASAFGLELVSDVSTFREGCCLALDFIDDEVPADGPEGQPVNPVAVQRIDDAVRRIGERVVMVVFALSGGIPAYRDQIRAVARFRFPDAAFRECVRVGDPETGLIGSRRPYLPPSESMRIRGEARRLIEHGDFGGAYALARQLYAQDIEKPWIEEVELAALYFQGQLPPLRRVPPYMKPITDVETAPRALLPAFRVEASLRAGRIPEAVIWTSAFVEAAVADQISALDFVETLDSLDRTITVRSGIRPHPDFLTPINHKGETMLQHRGRNVYRFWVSGPTFELWFKHFPQDCALALRRFRRGLKQQTERGVTLQDARNALSHGILPRDSLEWLERGFVKAGLWQPKSAGNPRFLANPDIRTLCEAANGEEPAPLYNRLVIGLRNTLQDLKYS